MRADALIVPIRNTRRPCRVALLIPVPLLVLSAASAAQETWTPTSTAGAPSARSYATGVWTGAKMIVWGGSGTSDPGYLNTGGQYDASADTWIATSTLNAPSGRGAHTAVWTGSKMIVWGGSNGWPFPTGGVYDPASDTWTATSVLNAPSARAYHTAVWTGSKMVVWGGDDRRYTATGGIYDPATDTWTATSTTNAPEARWWHTAVWTGSKMIVWGGLALLPGRGSYDNTGGIYDPATDTWTATSTANAPTARYLHAAVWTGSKMIVWGGCDGSSCLSTGGIYDPATDTWTVTSTMNAPSARHHHAEVWTGSKMIVWGGYDEPSYVDTGGMYDPSIDAWAETSRTNAPTARVTDAAVWTGSSMIVWGGGDPSGLVNTGGVYSNPALLPPPSLPAAFYTLTPCRLVDTRNATGPTGGPALYPGAIRTFPLTGGVCGVPNTATAVSVNVTAVGAVTQGYLTLYRGDVTSPPRTSSVNFSADQTRASNAIIALGASVGTINVKNGSAAPVHLVLDVSGYFQ